MGGGDVVAAPPIRHAKGVLMYASDAHVQDTSSEALVRQMRCECRLAAQTSKGVRVKAIKASHIACFQGALRFEF